MIQDALKVVVVTFFVMLFLPMLRDIWGFNWRVRAHRSERDEVKRQQEFLLEKAKAAYPVVIMPPQIETFVESLERHDGWSEILTTYAECRNKTRVEVVYMCSDERKAATIHYDERTRQTHIQPVTFREFRYKIITNESLVLHETVYITPSMGPLEILAQIRYLCPSMHTYQCITDDRSA